MIKQNIFSFTITSMVFYILALGLAFATESNLPADRNFHKPEIQLHIKDLPNLPIKAAFNRLKSEEFIYHSDLLDHASSIAFGQRKKQSVDFALEIIRLPVREKIEDKEINRFADFQVAKSILQVFPNVAVQPLLNLYTDGEPTTKVNIIRASGKIDHRRIDALLIEALDDTTFLEEVDPEVVGEPLRICDEAYNQIVLHFRIKNLPRTIGNATSIEDRDSYIKALQNLF